MAPNALAALTLSDHLLEALHAISRARKLVKDVPHVEAVHVELTASEVAITRVLGLVAGQPEG